MLKALLSKEDVEKLPTDVQAHYVKPEQDDGLYALGVTPVNGVEVANTVNLKKSLESERSLRGKAEKDLKTLTERVGDMDIDASRDAVAKLAEYDGMDPEGKMKTAQAEFEKTLTAKFEKSHKGLVAKHETELKTSADKLDVVTKQLQAQLIASAALKALAAHKGTPELMLPIVERAVTMKQQEDGTFVAVVHDSEGIERISPNPQSQARMTVEELVAELHADKKYAGGFEGTGASGTGAGRSSSTGSGVNAHRISAEDAKNPQKYRAAKEAAEKAGKTLELAPAP